MCSSDLYVSFILALSAAGMVLSDPTVPEQRRRLLTGALIVFIIATLFTSDAGRMFGRQGIQWAKAFGVYLWASAVVVTTMVWAARRMGPFRLTIAP